MSRRAMRRLGKIADAEYPVLAATTLSRLNLRPRILYNVLLVIVWGSCTFRAKSPGFSLAPQQTAP